MKEGNVQGVFQTPFFFGEIEYDYEIPTEGFEDGHNRDTTNDGEGVFSIAPNVIQLDLPDLEEKILECCANLVEQVGFEEQPMKINQMWLNAYDENRSGLPVHWHQNCAWSGTYYPVDANHTAWYVNPNAGFQNLNVPKVKHPSDFNTDYLPIRQMKKGHIVIHPPWVGHSVTWHGGEPSYSISFDIAYKGPIGDKAYGSYNDGQ